MTGDQIFIKMTVNRTDACSYNLSATNLNSVESLTLIETVEGSQMKNGQIYLQALVFNRESKLYEVLNREAKEIVELVDDLTYKNECSKERKEELNNFNNIVNNGGVKFNSRKNSIIRKMSNNIRKNSQFASPMKSFKSEVNMPTVKKSTILVEEPELPNVNNVQKGIVILLLFLLLQGMGRNSFLGVSV